MKKQDTAITPKDHLLTESDICTYLRIRPRQLYTWRQNGLVPYIRILHLNR